MELNEEGVALVADLLKLPKEKVLEIVPADDAPAQFKKLAEAALKTARDEGHQKGTGKTSKDLLAALKAEFDIDLTGVTPAEIAKSLKEAVSEQGSDELTEEAVKASEWYKELQSDAARKEAKRGKEIEKGIKEGTKAAEENFKKELKAAKSSGYLTELEVAAGEFMEAEGYILSDDPAKRKKQIKLVLKEGLDGLDVEKDEDGDFTFIKDGLPATKDGKSIGLEDVFSVADDFFNKKTVQQRSSSQLDPNNPGGKGKSGEFKHWKGAVPKDDKEMEAITIKRANREISSEEYKEVSEAFKASKAA